MENTTRGDVTARGKSGPHDACMLSICCICQRIRNDQNVWISAADWPGDTSDVPFSHSYCPVCLEDQLGRLSLA